MGQQHAERLRAIEGALGRHDLDALVISQPLNRRYLTGFTGSSGFAVIAPDRAFLLTDSRYYEQVEREAPEVELVRVGYRTMARLSEVLADLSATRVGFEADAITVNEFRRLKEHCADVDWMATTGLVERFRAVKAEREIEIIARAVDVADRTMALVFEVARPGMSERQLAWRIEMAMREHGADGMAFEPIVAAGENSALPHHRPSDRNIAAGEPIVVDIGAKVDGYNSDLTRTFTIGPPADAEFERVYGIVDRANRAAADGLRAGISGEDADALARDIIKGEGYGDQFGHGLGHGVGLNVHEGPRLSYAAGDSPLRDGMVVTIEPGIYLPGRFGVRIEDIAVVRDGGADVLTGVPKRPTLALASGELSRVER